MRQKYQSVAYSLIAALLIACRANAADPNVITPAPTLNVSCASLDANWGTNWPTTIEILDGLITAKQSCGRESLLSKKYAALFNYATTLEQNGNVDAAITQYRAAFAIDSHRNEALNALIRHNALPTATPPACHSALNANSDPASPETPNVASFVKDQSEQLLLNDQPFRIKGVNYYPRQTPWDQFLTETKIEDMKTELALVGKAGFNTIRVFLRYEPLFACHPEDAIPIESTFAKVDALLEFARQNNLKVIVTLNDLLDLVYRPLYTDWVHYDAQTVYIVRRYRNNPTILAWDLRNEGDLDSDPSSSNPRIFSQEEVIKWLAHVSQLVHENDPYHLITAGWWGDPTDTSPYVDILSFHHWSGTDQLQTRILDYQHRNDKPLLLEEIGYHSWADSPQDPRSLQGQAGILGPVINLADKSQIAGWVVWTAFDFVPQNGQPLTDEDFFGLWQTDLTPKPALKALPLP